jgi:hypothetical protein
MAERGSERPRVVIVSGRIVDLPHMWENGFVQREPIHDEWASGLSHQDCGAAVPCGNVT